MKRTFQPGHYDIINSNIYEEVFLLLLLSYTFLYSGSKMCFEDGTPLSEQQIFRDVACNREMMQLQCFCPGKNRGCNWSDALEFLEVCVCIDFVAI